MGGGATGLLGAGRRTSGGGSSDVELREGACLSHDEEAQNKSRVELDVASWLVCVGVAAWH